MNILMILSSFEWGEKGYYYPLIKALKAKGHMFTVISGGGIHINILSKIGIKLYKCGLMHSRFYRPIRFCYYRWYFGFFLIVKRIMKMALLFPLWILWLIRTLIIVKQRKINIIHTNGIGPHILGFLCAKLINIPMTIWVADSSPTDLNPKLFRIIYPVVKKVLPLCKESADFATRGFEKGKDKMIIIGHPIDIDKFRPFSTKEKALYLKTLLNEGYLIEPSTYKIVIVSRLDQRKIDLVFAGIKAVPMIITKIPNIQLIIAGMGHCFQQIRSMAQAINNRYNKNIIVNMGYREDVNKIMNSADIVLAVGRTAIEAMACGKAVIIGGDKKGIDYSPYGGIVTKDNIQQCENYLFTGRHTREHINPQKIAQDCIKLLKNEDLRRRLGQFGRQYVIRKFNIDKIAPLFEEIHINATKCKKS